MSRFLSFISIALFMAGIQVNAQQTIGTFINESEALNAYTLFSPTFGRNTYIIDNCGEKINEWTHDQRTGLGAYLMPDGRLLRTANIPHPLISQTSQGGLIEIYAWDGQVEWSHDFSSERITQHHAVELMPNGNLLVMAWEYLFPNEVEALGRDTDMFGLREMYSEAIFEIKILENDSAEIIWEWHLMDHFVQDFDNTKPNYVSDISAHPRKMNFNYFGISSISERDWFHCNSIDYHAQRDEIIVNCRNGNEFWIIDHSTTSAQAATDTGGIRGYGGDFLFRWGNPAAYNKGITEDILLYGAHGTSWIPEGLPNGGRIILFNNGPQRPGPNFSTIEIVAPIFDNDGNYVLDSNGLFQPQSALETISPSDQFYSRFQSNAKYLSNGNLFTNRGDYGHMVEFNASGDIVWEYVNPVGALSIAQQGQMPVSSSVFHATRLPVTHSAFTGKDLTPQGVIELNSDYTDCEIFSKTGEQDKENIAFSVFIQDAHLIIRPDINSATYNVTIFDIHGHRLLSNLNQQYEQRIPISNWLEGMYFVRILFADNLIVTKSILILG